MNAQHALIISTATPPVPESHTIRNAFLCRGLVERGWTVSFIGMESASADSSLTELLPTCDVVRTPPSPYLRRQTKLAGYPCGKLLNTLYGVYSTFFAIPDAHVGWDRMVIEQVRRLPMPKPEIVIAASSSYTAQIAAAQLSSKWNVPYVADLGDPWAYNPIWPANLLYRKWRNWRLESAVLSKAAALIVTTDTTAALYRKLFNNTLRVEVVPCGFSSQEFASVPPRPSGQAIKVTYVGVAYRTGRNLRPIMDGLAKVAKTHNVELHIVGPHNRTFEEYVAAKGYNFVRFEGRVSYADSIEKIIDSDILTVVGNPGGLQIPGKLYMYLASGRPLLYCCQDEPGQDPGWHVAKQFAGTEVCRLDSGEVSSALERMVRNIEDYRCGASARSHDVRMQNFNWRYLGSQYADVMQSILRPAKLESNLDFQLEEVIA